MHYIYTHYYIEESWMPFRSAGTLLVVRADRLGKTGAMWGNTLSLRALTSLSLAAVVVLWILWASTDGWVSFVSMLSWDSLEGHGNKSFNETVISRPLRWRTFV